MKQDLRIRELSKRHKRLEQELETVQKIPSSTDQSIVDLKRRKLKIKDEIQSLRSS
jgi:hypothetical protein